MAGAMGVCFLFGSCLVLELRVGLGDSASARTSGSASPRPVTVYPVSWPRSPFVWP